MSRMDEFSMRIRSMMAYDEQRPFAARPPQLPGVVHGEHDARRTFGREQSVGFQYVNRPSFVQHPLVSPRAYTQPVHTAGPSRRPLPTPRTRPESMPPPLRQFPLVVQAPAPSRPVILPSSATLSMAVSPTVPPARRPLPTPTVSPPRPVRKHTSIDLTARPTSPVKNVINTSPDRDLRIPSSFTRRVPDTVQPPPLVPAASFHTPPPTWPRSPHSDPRGTNDSTFAPLWDRNLPVAQIGASVIERRSTVSGVLPVVLPPRLDSRVTSPERAQPAQPPQTSSTRRPLPTSPTEPPRVPSLQSVPASLEDERDASPPFDRSSLSDEDTYQPMTFADPLHQGNDEGNIAFERKVHTPSPEYGIRDLPSRSRIAIANRSDSQHVNVIVSDARQEQVTRPPPSRSVTLPQTPTSSPTLSQNRPQPGSVSQTPPARMSPPLSGSFSPFPNRSPLPDPPTPEPQSLTLRLASMGLAQERQRERERQSRQAVSSPTLHQSPTRAAPGPTSPVRQQPAWPTNLPPLPRTPGNASRPLFGTTAQGQPLKPNGTSSSPASLPTSPTHHARPFSSSPNASATFDQKSFAQPLPRQPHVQSQRVAQLSERQLQKQKERDMNIDLDDAPPPSLRRSPSPNRRQDFTRAPTIEITSDTPPRRQWSPGQDFTSRTSDARGNNAHNSYVGSRVGSQSPERREQLPTQSLIGSPIQPYQPPVPSISLPDDHHDCDDVDNGPSIIVSGPANGPTVSISPAVSTSVPSIVASEHGTPAIVVSADSPSIAFSSPTISVLDSSQPQRAGPTRGGFGSRHTQIQESVPLPSAPSRGPGSKRGLPNPPASSTPLRTNGLSCGGCNGPIIGRIVSAMGQRWHPDCFRCTICNELLEHVSSYEHDGRPYCHLDYHETFAPRCFHCQTAIIDERFITLDDPALGKRTYHEQHFFCAECGDPFLAPSGPLPPSLARMGELNVTGDGEFVDDDVGFTVYKGHPYCEACHVRLRMPKCKACKKSIRDGVRAVEALGGKWCWGCFVCEGCKKPFEDPSFFLRSEKPYCEGCFSLILRNEV